MQHVKTAWPVLVHSPAKYFDITAHILHFISFYTVVLFVILTFCPYQFCLITTTNNFLFYLKYLTVAF